MSIFNAGTLYALPQLGFVLGIMVLVHEFGHFAAAKLCRVRVEAFAIGFGKKLIGWESGGTSYQLNLLPLGGYVKMAGEMPGEEHHSDDPGEFQNHPRWQRMIITLAGPIANFILSLALVTGLFLAHHETENFINQPVVADYVSPNSAISKTGVQTGDRVVRIDAIENPTWGEVAEYAAMDASTRTPFAYLHEGKRVDTLLALDWKERRQFDPGRDLGLVPLMQDSPVVVEELVEGAPAKAAGLQIHDQILAIDNLHPHSVQALIAYLQDGAGKPVVMTVARKAGAGLQTIHIPVTPVYVDAQEGKQWQTGFRPVPPPSHLDHLTLLQAAQESWKYNLKNSQLIFVVLQRLFTNQVSIKSLSSPIGIGVQVHQAFEDSSASNPLPVLATMAMISLNLGIFNLLPIPILDGGMMVFLLIESLIRRDLNPRFKERIYQVAFVCILLFAAVVIFNDLTKFLPLHLKS